jgi:hypothetical protein
MEGINAAIPCDNQPIGGGHSAATLFSETKFLTDWIQSQSIDVQNKYDELTTGLQSTLDKIKVCLSYVSGIPYTQFVRVSTHVGDKTFIQPDAWLLPEQAISVGKLNGRLNCANKTYLLVSLLRRELPPENIWACLGNLNMNHHQEGHAFGYIRLNKDYILETTNPAVNNKLIPIDTVGNIYEDVVYFNDSGVRAVPQRQVREPFSACYNCVPFLKDYLAKGLCNI